MKNVFCQNGHIAISVGGRSFEVRIDELVKRLSQGDDFMALFIFSEGLAIHQQFIMDRPLRQLYIKQDYVLFKSLFQKLDQFYRLFSNDKIGEMNFKRLFKAE